MPRKRQACTSAPAGTSSRGRPKRTTRSTYASASKAQVKQEEPTPANQPSVEGVQPNPNPTPEQVLQQLQADLQNAQQERGRITATFIASQRAIQMSQQIAEVRQQLAILQAKIQSLQSNQPLSINSNQPQPAAQSQPNPSPSPQLNQPLAHHTPCHHSRGP
jgi:hypothetical protein